VGDGWHASRHLDDRGGHSARIDRTGDTPSLLTSPESPRQIPNQSIYPGVVGRALTLSKETREHQPFCYRGAACTCWSSSSRGRERKARTPPWLLHQPAPRNRGTGKQARRERGSIYTRRRCCGVREIGIPEMELKNMGRNCQLAQISPSLQKLVACLRGLLSFLLGERGWILELPSWTRCLCRCVPTPPRRPRRIVVA
jgi:hypothetical protein